MDGVNAFLVNTTDVQGAISKLGDILNGKHDLAAMRKAAIATAPRFSMERASAETAATFRRFHQQWQARQRMRYGPRHKPEPTQQLAAPAAARKALRKSQ